MGHRLWRAPHWQRVTSEMIFSVSEFMLRLASREVRPIRDLN
jgi:hypothetical protein